MKQADHETNMVPESPPNCNQASPLLHSLFYNYCDLIFHLLLAVRSEKFLRSLAALSLSSLLNFLSRMSQQTYVATTVFMWRPLYLCSNHCTYVATTVLMWRPLYLCSDYCTYVATTVLMWRLLYLCGDHCTYK
jgi:hypothetical protein